MKRARRKKDYEKYLQSSHWRSFRLRYKSERPWACGHLGCPAGNLDLHHLTYARLGRESLDDVIPLCRPHHAQAHQLVGLGIPLQTAHLHIEQKVLVVPAREKAKKQRKVRKVKQPGKQALAVRGKSYNEVTRLSLDPGSPIERPTGDEIIARKLAERQQRSSLRRRLKTQRI